MAITGWTAGERWVAEAFARGAAVDLGGAEPVRGEVLRAVLLGEQPPGGGVPAMVVRGARISGALDLGYGTVPYPVALTRCTFEQVPELGGASLRALDLSGSRLPGLSAADLRVEGALRLTRCRVAGPTVLDGAGIGSALDLRDAELLGGPEQVAADPALSAANSRVEGGVSAGRLTARGTVLLTGARVEGTLNLEDARLSAANGEALVAPVLTVGLDLLGKGMQAYGEVRLARARIGGRLQLEGARLRNPGGAALRIGGAAIGAGVWAPQLDVEGRLSLRGAHITGALMLAGGRFAQPDGSSALAADGAQVAELRLERARFASGSVSLRGATFTTVRLTPEVWPETVHLDGLTYQALAPHLPPRERLAPLARDVDGYVPYAYEQLAGAYRRAGDEPGARTVQLAKHRHYRSTLPRHARAWGLLQDVTVGYGYRPLRAAGWLLALLAFGTVLYGLHHPAALKPAEAPAFNPLFYTLDLLLPIVGFGQENAFRPAGGWQWLAHSLTVLGWILATTVLTGVTRALSRQ